MDGLEKMALKGMVYLVGAGPGDPSLLTVRAQTILSHADAVVYDTLINPAIVQLAPSRAMKIFRGKRTQRGALSQESINRLLVRLARQGKKVIRLKGGDPFVFGRGAEEAQALVKAGVAYEIVPGISSSIAVPAYAGIPVTHRSLNSCFTVVTGHEDPSKDNPKIDWTNLAQSQGTLIFLMGLRALRQVCQRLIQEGKPAQTPAAVIQSGTTSRQKTIVGTLTALPELVERAKLKPPATVVVGPVVQLRKTLSWVQHRPLFGKRVLVTRGRLPYNSLSEMLSENGAEVVEIPTIKLLPIQLSASQCGMIRRASTYYDWIFFSSANGIEFFMNRFFESGLDVRSLKGVRIACMGEATASALMRYGLKADLIPSEFKQEGLIRAFKALDWIGKKVLMPTAKGGREVLIRFLRKRGAKVQHLNLYENRVPTEARRQIKTLFAEQRGVDLLTFASSSSVDHFFTLLTPVQRKKWIRSLPLAVIGPVTARAARKWKAKVTIQPSRYTVPDLVEAIVKWARKNKAQEF